MTETGEASQGASLPASGGAGHSAHPARMTALVAVLALQLLLSFGFLAFFIYDTLPLRTRPVGYTLREVLQITGVLALGLSVIINLWLVGRIAARARAAERGLLVARGAFGRLMHREFTNWNLSATERDIALYAIKGFSNAEIAAMTGKSEGTVKSQTAAVFRKAGVQGRIGLLTYFMDELLAESLLPRDPDGDRRS